MFRQVGIYAHAGQLYEPVDSDQLMYYKEAENGQILEEGITEAGSMASFIAAGTAYSQHGINMIPFFIYYSMFGFQRIGDLIWAAADMRAKGFLIGGTAGRTTLNGEGLQHQDGHSLLNAIAFPTVRAYDPAFAYETAVIVFDGLRRLYQEGETAIYYITVENENYDMPAMPEGVEEGIIRGMYKSAVPRCRRGADLGSSCSAAVRSCAACSRPRRSWPRSIGVSSDVWSVTSYTQLRRDAQDCQRWNHAASDPDAPPSRTSNRRSPAGRGRSSPPPTTCGRWRNRSRPGCPADLFALGTDGMGRSETRENLRRHFEVDAEMHRGRQPLPSVPTRRNPQLTRRRRDPASWDSIRTK